MDDVKDLLEKQEKYKWHDLRKNPEDLPEIPHWTNYSEAVEVVVSGGIYDTAVYGKRGFLGGLEGEFSWFTESEPIIAWRYIEPFEEGDTE